MPGPQPGSVQIRTRQQLQRQWRLAVVLTLLLLFTGFIILHRLWQPAMSKRWILQAAMIAAYTLWLLRSGLKLNYHPHQQVLLADLGGGTWITLLRGMLIAMVAGFLFQPRPGSSSGNYWLSWVPGVIYLAAAGLDYVDGLMARISNHETRLGELLDIKIDALGLLIAPLLAVGYRQLPVYYLFVGIAFYVFRFAVWLREKIDKPCLELRPRPDARMLAGFQMGFVGIVLLPVFTPPATTIAAIIFMAPFLAGFIRDWAAVCGYLKTGPSLRARWEEGLDLFMTGLLPIFLRLLIVFALMILFKNTWTDAGLNRQAATNYFISPAGGTLLFWLLMLVSLMLVFGILVRSAALFAGLVLAWIMSQHETSWMQIVLFSSMIVLSLTGSGPFSTWQPEDKFIKKKLG
jgi:CDP-diacylglycerol--glycerol-3-phosphate 3-phosphatidyltransferase